MRRFPRKFTTRYAKDMLYHANLHCRFGSELVERPADVSDMEAASLLFDLFRILVVAKEAK